MSNIALFILTHGRAHDIKTYETLKRFGTEKDVFLIVDDMDDELDEYRNTFKNVEVFDKRSVDVDTMTNAEEWCTPVYARNYAFELAKKKGYDYFVMLDDDISDLKIRAEKDGKLRSFDIKSIDDVFDGMAEFMAHSSVALLGFLPSGAYIGGLSGAYREKVKRDITQVFMCRTKDGSYFKGVMNEDYIASLALANDGKTALSLFLINLFAPTRMSNKGGLHDTYAKMGVYVRDFYTCIAYPSTGRFTSDLVFKRVKRATFPMIISEAYKK